MADQPPCLMVVRKGICGGPDDHYRGWMFPVHLEVWTFGDRGDGVEAPDFVVHLDIKRLALLKLLGEEHRELIYSKDKHADAMICDLLMERSRSAAQTADDQPSPHPLP